MLKDILETTTSEKGYELRPSGRSRMQEQGEDDGKLAAFETSGVPKANALTTGTDRTSMVAEPIRIGTIETNAKKQSHDSKRYRVYSPKESNDPVRRRRQARCKAGLTPHQ